MLHLDFSIENIEDRNDYIKNYIKDKNLSKTDLETIANYILYGKDSDGLSAVDKKEIQIKSKYSSYNKKEPESLDELMENPGFNENVFSLGANKYKTIKPKIEREKDFDIPNMQDLWKVIDNCQYIIDVNNGKIEDKNVKKLSSLELYKLKHLTIDLRRQQFYLKDIFNPTICMFGINAKKPINIVDNEIPWDLEDSNYSIAPLGVINGYSSRFINPRLSEEEYSYNKNAKYILDFRNKDHIYYLLEHYEDLKISTYNKPQSIVKNILDTLNFYIDFADLSPTKKKILILKQKKFSNVAIQQIINKEFNLKHSANYISTIWKQQICEDIANAAILHYDEYLYRKDKMKWKKCNQCGEYKLIDNRNFMNKSRSSDGYSNKCKKCDKINRNKKKKR